MKNISNNAPGKEVRDDEDRYGYLKELDTLKLQALLHQESLLNKNFDVELVQQINTLLDERDPVFNDFDVEASLETFLVAVAPYIDNKVDESIVNIPRRQSPKRKIKIILIAALITILLGSMLVSNALGHNIWELLVNWGKETFHIGTSGEVTGGIDSSAEGTLIQNKNINYESIEEAVKAFSNEVLIPQWIPDGFEFMQATISETPGHKSLIHIFHADGKIITFSVDCYDNKEPSYFYEKNEDSGETIIIDGRDHYFMTNFEQNSVVWAINNYVYSINGDVSHNDLKRMINSIYEGDE